MITPLPAHDKDKIFIKFGAFWVMLDRPVVTKHGHTLSLVCLCPVHSWRCSKEPLISYLRAAFIRIYDPQPEALPGKRK